MELVETARKYACESCIKGHRASTCKHQDRPLFEVKKKGRPASQCNHCRELRKTKKVHVKCCERVPVRADRYLSLLHCTQIDESQGQGGTEAKLNPRKEAQWISQTLQYSEQRPQVQLPSDRSFHALVSPSPSLSADWNRAALAHAVYTRSPTTEHTKVLSTPWDTGS
ncbi:copper fist DNA binding domain-containing protein [Ephemerocybe angulata]|uniref:Copper fist DNA binding domain-containing protein n=1 Tax=Ephemerocybe angulata TaxID=980116 RepID=A0A8H6IEX1_9AGAR|nr:copper fist DNA binding domain-containing protein [Tulosesus angulatus]